MATERIPIYDQRGTYIRAVERGALYESGEHNHRVVHNLVYLPVGMDMEPERMWVQQRGPKTNYLRGYFVTAAGGHLNMGDNETPETFEEAMAREVSEELFDGKPVPGWQMRQLGSTFAFLPDYPGYTGGSKEVATFVSESDGRHFAPSQAEVAALMPMSVGQLKEMARDPNSLLHPEFREILKRKMTRIGIVGTYSAGKTTLTNALSERITGSVGVTEDVRHYVRQVFGKKGIQELTPEQFIELEHMLYRDQTMASRLADIAIIDSTPIGCPVYLTNYGLLAQNGHQFDQSVIDGWVERTRSTLQEYDVIVYLPPEIPYENDGFRTGPQFRGPLDQGFRDAIEGHPRVIEVTGYVEGDVQAGVQRRVDTVLEHCVREGIVDEERIVQK